MQKSIKSKQILPITTKPTMTPVAVDPPREHDVILGRGKVS